MLEGQFSTGQGAAHVTLSWGMAQPLEPSPPSERALKQQLMQKGRVRTKPHMAGQTLHSNVTQQLDFNHICCCCLLGLQDFLFSCRCQAPSWTQRRDNTYCMQLHSSGGKSRGKPCCPKKRFIAPETKCLWASTAPSTLPAGRGSPAGCQEGTACPKEKQQCWKEPSPHRGWWWKLTEGICPVF